MFPVGAPEPEPAAVPQAPAGGASLASGVTTLATDATSLGAGAVGSHAGAGGLTASGGSAGAGGSGVGEAPPMTDSSGREIGPGSGEWAGGPTFTPGRTPVAPDPFFNPTPSDPPKPEPRPAVLAARIRIARRDHGDRPMLISHGFGLGGVVPHDQEPPASGAPSDALLSLSDDDVRAIAEDLLLAIVGVHPDKVEKARQDQHWDAHLGAVIRDAWANFQACVGTDTTRDDHFRTALNRILAEGRSVF